MATKHTPGPWCVSDHDTQEIRGAGPDYRGDIASVHVSIDPERMDADARLIAAAPDLLAACEAALDSRIETIRTAYGIRNAKDDSPAVKETVGADYLCVQLRAALAKARP